MRTGEVIKKGRKTAGPAVPALPEGATEDTYQELGNELRSHWKKSKVNHQRVAELMELTFPQRRRKILEGVAVDDVMTDFPTLKSHGKVCVKLLILAQQCRIYM